MWGCGLRLWWRRWGEGPGVEGGDAGAGKVGEVAGNDGEAVDEGGGGDEAVELGAGIGDVERCTALGDSEIDGENPTGERGKDAEV